MPRRQYRGAAAPLTLSGAITSGTLVFTAAGDVTGWPPGATAKFYIEIDRGVAGKAEKILVTSRSGNSFTVGGAGDRGVDDTTAIAHSSGAVVEHVLDSDTIDEANAHVNDTSRDDHPQYLNTTRHDVFGRHLLGTSVPTGVPGTAAAGDTPNEGVATSAARSDHKHGMPALGLVGDVTASAVGDTASAGTSPRASHADHKHAREGFGAPAASAPGDAAVTGTATTVAHSDHKHAREASPSLTIVGDVDASDQGITAGGEITMLSRGITLTAQRLVEIHYSAQYRGSTGVNFAGNVNLKINGTTVDGDRYHSHGKDVICKGVISWKALLAAGSYTILVTTTNDPLSDTTVIADCREMNVSQIGG